MNEADATHPRLADLAAFAAGQLGSDAQQTIESHLAGCAECGRRFDALPEDPFAALVRAAADWTVPAATATPPEPFEVPPALADHARYRVLGRIGSGGMGVVCKAVHRMMDRVVALKVPHPHLLQRPGFAERFRQEARAAARLVHPHIVLVHDAEEISDPPFLVMEYVPGVSLDRLVAEQGPLPVAAACDCIRQAALGLHHAHEHGLIHRDVKPGNLMRTPAGVVKVLDFGLARLVQDTQTSTTPGGTLAGTPDYLAPEQARDPGSVDARADIYSLGGTLYFLLTGRPPFADGTALRKLLAHQDRAPTPVAEIRSDVPADLATLLDRMLAKDPARRPQSCAEVARLLAPFTDNQTPTELEERRPRPIARKPRRWPWVIVPLVVVTAGLVLLLARPWAHQVPPPPDGPPATPAANLLSADQVKELKSQRREQALAWIRDNNVWGDAGTIIQHIAQEIDSSFDRMESFQLLIGAKLLRSGQPALVAAHPGGFFVFTLTPAQAKALQFDETTCRWRVCRKAIDARRPVPHVHLSDLRFDHRDKQPSAARLTGKVHYEIAGAAVAGPFAVRVTFYHRGLSHAGLIWFRGRTLQGTGDLEFDCPPVGSYRDRPHGPLVFFAEVVTEAEGRIIVESDACAALVEVSPPS
jgi:serine/threonine protein kinase